MEQQTEEVKADEKNIQVQNTPATEATQPVVETDKDINWKKFKENRELDRKAKEEAVKRAAEKEQEVAALKAAMDAILNKQPNQRQEQQINPNYSNEYETQEETEEQRIERKVNAAIAQREARAEKERREREQAEYPEKLVSDFKDFNQVCNASNLDYLEYHYPEVAEPYKHLPEGYSKWAAIYKAVKRFVPNTDSRKEQAKAESNFKKPQSISSPGMSQGGDAMPPARLDEARKASNWQRMQKAMKGLS